MGYFDMFNGMSDGVGCGGMHVSKYGNLYDGTMSIPEGYMPSNCYPDGTISSVRRIKDADIENVLQPNVRGMGKIERVFLDETQGIKHACVVGGVTTLSDWKRTSFYGTPVAFTYCKACGKIFYSYTDAKEF